MSIVHPVTVNPVVNPLVGILNMPAWRAGKLAPQDAILHFDADLDAFAEQTGGVHKFNHAVLSPQYQRNADGSYSNVGAKPAVDVLGGEKWLRSCGAVTNLLTNSVFAGAVSGTPGTPPTGWSIINTDNKGKISVNGSEITAENVGVDYARCYLQTSISAAANSTYIFEIDARIAIERQIQFYIGGLNPPTGAVLTTLLNGIEIQPTELVTVGLHKLGLKCVFGATSGAFYIRVGVGVPNWSTGTITISNPQLTATAYPQPYVPTTTAGPVTQPASNATTTNGSWFTLPDGSPLWQALTGSPLTLATRIRMGVGSGDWLTGVAVYPFYVSQSAGGYLQYSFLNGANIYAVTSYDGAVPANTLPTTWPRNAIIRRITQVNTAGTQFRVGYMIEGTNTAIQWGSWVNFDGSFNPSTLYRLMLGYNNAYPMWFNKITAWKEQVSDARILEAMA